MNAIQNEIIIPNIFTDARLSREEEESYMRFICAISRSGKSIWYNRMFAYAMYRLSKKREVITKIAKGEPVDSSKYYSPKGYGTVTDVIFVDDFYKIPIDSQKPQMYEIVFKEVMNYKNHCLVTKEVQEYSFGNLNTVKKKIR